MKPHLSATPETLPPLTGVATEMEAEGALMEEEEAEAVAEEVMQAEEEAAEAEQTMADLSLMPLTLANMLSTVSTRPSLTVRRNSAMMQERTAKEVLQLLPQQFSKLKPTKESALRSCPPQTQEPMPQGVESLRL